MVEQGIIFFKGIGMYKYLHVIFGGGALAIFINKSKLEKMKLLEKVLYVICSILCGIYLGDAFVEWAGINPASRSAKASGIVIAIFGLGILALIRDGLAKVVPRVMDGVGEGIISGIKSWFGKDK